MKSPLDDARLRLSAATPEMSTREHERTVLKIVDGMTMKEVEEQMKFVAQRLNRTSRDLLILQKQKWILQDAYYLKQRTKP